MRSRSILAMLLSGFVYVGAAHGSASICAGGPSEPIVADVGARDLAGLAIEIGLATTWAAPARARYALELVDDRGKQIIAPRRSEVVTLGDARRQLVERLPAGLADGWYVVRVTVAARAGAERATTVRELFFEVERGAAVLLTPAEYHARSRA